jgi:hypothetical protein
MAAGAPVGPAQRGRGCSPAPVAPAHGRLRSTRATVSLSLRMASAQSSLWVEGKGVEGEWRAHARAPYAPSTLSFRDPPNPAPGATHPMTPPPTMTTSTDTSLLAACAMEAPAARGCLAGAACLTAGWRRLSSCECIPVECGELAGSAAVLR